PLSRQLLQRRGDKHPHPLIRGQDHPRFRAAPFTTSHGPPPAACAVSVRRPSLHRLPHRTRAAVSTVGAHRHPGARPPRVNYALHRARTGWDALLPGEVTRALAQTCVSNHPGDPMNAQRGTIIVTISPTWTDVVQAAGALLVPVVVAGLAYVLTRNQSRSQELVRARLEYYKLLAPDLNRLMCYITFIGGWRDDSPEAIIALKRRLGANFYSAAPLFSSQVLDVYNGFMQVC